MDIIIKETIIIIVTTKIITFQSITIRYFQIARQPVNKINFNILLSSGIIMDKNNSKTPILHLYIFMYVMDVSKTSQECHGFT